MSDVSQRLKNRTRKRSERMVASGLLRSADVCEKCGEGCRKIIRSNGKPYSLLQMHHPDYNDASHILWLCHLCHMTIHGRISRPKVLKKSVITKATEPKKVKTPKVIRAPKKINILWAHNAYPGRDQARLSIEIAPDDALTRRAGKA